MNFSLRCTLGMTTVVLALAAFAHAGDAPYPQVFQEDFSKGADRWEPSDPKAWKVDKTDEGFIFNQFQQSVVKTPHRSPFNMNLVKDLTLTDFVLEAKLQSTAKDVPHRDMCLFFGYQDPAHLYYVHMAKAKDDHANQIFIVNGADRLKISKTTSNGTPWDDKWHNVKIVRKVDPGLIEIYWDDMKNPIMTAEDKTFTWGRVGIGSFDDTGIWSEVKVWGKKK